MLGYDNPSSSKEPSALRYLETEVRMASPAKLRLMLIEKAIGICHLIASRWKVAKPELGYDEHTIHLRDILTELLAGVGKNEAPVALQVADLYVFLTKHLTSAELMRDPTMIDEIRTVLETEAETWRIVCANLRAANPNSHSQLGTANAPKPAGLNLQG